MIQKAGSISECPDIERIWHLDPTPSNVTSTSHAVQLSHSDIGPYIHLICREGYHVVGPKMITCLKGGRWDDTTKPYCSASLLYEIPQSTALLIGVLSACGAVVLIALTIILAHLLCFKKRNARPALSTDRLNRSIDGMGTTNYYVEDKAYSISAPQYPTRNGKPLTSDRHHYSNTTSSQASPRVNGHIETISDSEVFVNHAYVKDVNHAYMGSRDYQRQYPGQWEHELQPVDYRGETAVGPPHTHTLPPGSPHAHTLPPGLQDNRTMF